MKIECNCNTVTEFRNYHKKTVELVGLLRREFEYRKKYDKFCNPDVRLQELIEDYIRETEES